MPRQNYAVLKLVTSKEQILHEYPDVFEGIGSFSGPPYHIQIDPSITPKQVNSSLCMRVDAIIVFTTNFRVYSCYLYTLYTILWSVYTQ